MRNPGSNGSRLSTEENEDEEMARLAISSFQARQEEMQRKKMEVKEKVELQLGRAEEESRRLAQIWEELASRELKPLGHSIQKKEKEYMEALKAFSEKSREKAQLVATLMELLTEVRD